MRLTNCYVAVFVVANFLSPVKAGEQNAGSGVGIRFIGHASVLISSDNSRILTDPFWGKTILLGLKRRIPPACKPEELPPIDLILVSHTHPDHYDPKNIEKIQNNFYVFLTRAS